MNCRDLEPLFEALAAGELDGAVGAAVEKHLAACKDCRREAEAARRIAAQLARTVMLEVPEEAARKVFTRIPGFAAARRRKVALRRRVLYGAAAATVALAALLQVLGAVDVAGRALAAAWLLSTPMRAASSRMAAWLVGRWAFLKDAPAGTVESATQVALVAVLLCMAVAGVDLVLADRTRRRLIRSLKS